MAECQGPTCESDISRELCDCKIWERIKFEGQLQGLCLELHLTNLIFCETVNSSLQMQEFLHVQSVFEKVLLWKLEKTALGVQFQLQSDHGIEMYSFRIHVL